MSLYEAVYTRKSVRKYNLKPIKDDQLELIIRFAKSLPMLFPDIMVEYTILDCTNKNYQKNYFNKFQPFKVEAPYYLIISSTRNAGYYINAGYLMQQISLYLTSKNVGSCFLGATRLKNQVIVDSNMEHIITLAFGESNKKVYRISDKAKRLPEKDTVIYKEDVLEVVKKIIKAGRLAPSSMNGQPWRFLAYKNRIHVFCKKDWIKSERISKLKQIDIGVAISNMLVAIDEMWLYADIVYSDNISKQSTRNYNYVLTLKLNSSLKDLSQDNVI